MPYTRLEADYRLRRRADLAILYQGGRYTLAVAARRLSLNATAFAVWEALNLPGKIEDVVERVAATAAQPEAVIADDVRACVQRFIDRGLVERAPMGAPVHRALYLNLLKKSLLNLLYAEDEFRLNAAEPLLEAAEPITAAGLKQLPRQQQAALQQQLGCRKTMTYLPEHRLQFAHSMVGESGLTNIEHCAEIVFAEGVGGDFLEAGVCRGGATIFMRALQKAFGQAQRRTFVADSFAGLPPPEHAVDRATGVDWSEAQVPPLACDLADVQELFARYGLAEEQVIYLKGWFPEPLHDDRIDQLAILRLDCDLYSSTTAVLKALYHKVSPGGFVIVDDYGFLPECRQAVDEFRQSQGIETPLTWVNSTCVYWRIAAGADRARAGHRPSFVSRLFGRAVESDFPFWPTLPMPDPDLAAADPTGGEPLRVAWAGRLNRPSKAPQPLQSSRRRFSAEGCVQEWADKNGDLMRVQVEPARQTISIAYSGPAQRSYEYLVAGVAGAAALHYQGESLWHASAVLTPRGALVFAAESGAGKSTLAAACVAEGLPLLGDEILMLQGLEGGCGIRGGHPMLKVTQDTATALSVQQTAPVYDWPFVSEECWLSALQLPGGYQEGCHRIWAIYLLQVPDESLRNPVFERTQMSATLHEQLRYGREWLPEPKSPQAPAPAADTPVFHLTLPRNLDRIRDSAAAVVRHAQVI